MGLQIGSWPDSEEPKLTWEQFARKDLTLRGMNKDLTELKSEWKFAIGGIRFEELLLLLGGC